MPGTIDTVQTRRLTLRAFAATDVDALYEIQGDRAHMAHTFWAESRAACARWLGGYADGFALHGFAPWTAVLRSNGRIVGWGGLNVDPNAPGWGTEVTYFVHQAYVGRGLATELVRASLALGFDELELAVIGAFASPANVGSARVLEKCGMRLIGYEAALARNHYELRRQDWIETAR